MLSKFTVSPPAGPLPEQIPEELQDEYLLGGLAKLFFWYFCGNSQSSEDEAKPYEWSASFLKENIMMAEEKAVFPNSYAEQTYAHQAVEEFPVKGQAGMVVGSITPWVEAILFANGARKVTTVEYNTIISGMSNLQTMTPEDLATAWLADSLEEVDFAVSFSSIEHNGLGRYGDALDPNGDLRDVKLLSCIIRLGGLLYLALPMGEDEVVFNAHRIYGPIRLPMLTSNFRVVGVIMDEQVHNLHHTFASRNSYHPIQPLTVLQNMRQRPCARAPLIGAR